MKRILFFSFFLFFILTIWVFVRTYGLLESKGSAEVSKPIGKWVIKLNGVDVTVVNQITESDLIYEANANVESGFFAPGVTANYEIVIDPCDTDVSIKYDIFVDMTDLNEHLNISFDVSGDVISNVVDDVVVYSGIIPLSDILAKKTVSIMANLVWNNDIAFDHLDNDLIDSSFNVKITIHFSQYLGEGL